MKKVLHLQSKFNSSKQGITHKEFFGAKHIVIEGVGSMICDTVMNGVLYTREAVEDLAAKTKDYIHAPASHPADADGNFISASSPAAIHQNYVGAFAFNYRMSGDRLIHDLAINPEIAERTEVGKELLDRIKNKTDIDTSTGLLIYELDETEGYGSCGMRYNMIAHNIELDHDAILLHEVGAATSKQGVGVFANSKNEKVDVETFSVNTTIANTTLEIVNEDYNESEAIERIKKYTNSIESPSSNYRRFFFYFDPSKKDSFDGYKFPFADIKDGIPVANSNAVFKAKAMIEKDESLSDSEKDEAYSSADIYAKKYEKANRSFFSNAWNSIKSIFFGNKESKDVEDKIFKALNEEKYTPTQEMSDNAKRALEMRDKQPDSNKGMTQTGLARARQLIDKQPLGIDIVKRMYSFFSRHEVDKQSDSWKEGDSKAEQAWLGWGGDAGYAWSKRIVEAYDKKKEASNFKYPVEVNKDNFIYQDETGNLFKRWYNIENDEVILLNKEEKVVKVNYDTEPLETNEGNDDMKDLIVKALKEAGVETEGLTDEQLLKAYNEMDSKEEDKKEVEGNEDMEDKEDKEAKNEMDEMDDVIESKVMAILEKVLADKLPKMNASEEDELAEKVEKLGLGINKKAAKAMGVNAMKDVLAANGVVAFNAKTDYNSKVTSTFSEMPD